MGIFIFVSMMIGVFGIFLYFIKLTIQSQRLKRQFQFAENELKKSKANEQQLREELLSLQHKIHYTSEDNITHLLSWHLFEDRLQQSIKESARHQFSLGILFVDIDNFKVINDALSYEIGDVLLQEVAKRLQACIRQVDSMTRFTKDTFVILLSQLSKPETAAVIAQRMLHALSDFFQIKEHELYITACIGIAIYPPDGSDASALLRSADHALHLAKKQGKHIYRFYQEGMHLKSQRELALYTDLSRETVFKEFMIYYQPIVNVENESILCMDALLYWQHAQQGLILSEELFHYAERKRKLNMITEWLLRNACAQFLHWQSMGFSPVLLGLPLSIKQLEDSHLVYQLSQILQTLSFKPEWLLLEVKESAVAIDYEVVEKAFNMLSYMGVNICIDQFGMGGLSLAILKKLPITYLKLDTTLTQDIVDNEKTRIVVESILSLASRLSMQVIVQAVESEAQAVQFKNLGYTLLQGKWLGAPLTKDQVAIQMVTSADS